MRNYNELDIYVVITAFPKPKKYLKRKRITFKAHLYDTYRMSLILLNVCVLNVYVVLGRC